MVATVSGWKSSLSVRQSFQYRMTTITVTTSTGMTTPTTTQRLLLWDSGDGLFTLSTAADEEGGPWNNSPAVRYGTAVLGSARGFCSEKPGLSLSFLLYTTGQRLRLPEDREARHI